MKSLPIETFLIRFPDTVVERVFDQARAAVDDAKGVAEDIAKQIARRFGAVDIVQVPQPMPTSSGTALVWQTWPVSREPSEAWCAHDDDRLIFDSESESSQVAHDLKTLFRTDEKAPYDPESAMRSIGFLG